MYSPKIADRLVPRLYRMAKARGQHMTALVAEIIEEYLARQPDGGNAPHDPGPDRGPSWRAPRPGSTRAARLRRPRRVRPR